MDGWTTWRYVPICLLHWTTLVVTYTQTFPVYKTLLVCVCCHTGAIANKIPMIQLACLSHAIAYFLVLCGPYSSRLTVSSGTGQIFRFWRDASPKSGKPVSTSGVSRNSDRIRRPNLKNLRVPFILNAAWTAFWASQSDLSRASEPKTVRSSIPTKILFRIRGHRVVLIQVLLILV